jgi:hypothetical protein
MLSGVWSNNCLPNIKKFSLYAPFKKDDFVSGHGPCELDVDDFIKSPDTVFYAASFYFLTSTNEPFINL